MAGFCNISCNERHGNVNAGPGLNWFYFRIVKLGSHIMSYRLIDDFITRGPFDAMPTEV